MAAAKNKHGTEISDRILLAHILSFLFGFFAISFGGLNFFIFVSSRQDNGTLKLSATIPLPVAIDQVLSL